MGDIDRFSAVLEEFTRRLSSEHQRDVQELNVKIRQLSSQLDRSGDSTSAWDEDGQTNREGPPIQVGDPAVGPHVNNEAATDFRRLSSSPTSLDSGMFSRTLSSITQACNHGLEPKLHVVSKSVMRLFSFEQEAVAYSGNPVLAFIERLVRSCYFDAVFGALIVLNAIVMAFEFQHHGYTLAVVLGSKDPSSGPILYWPGADHVFDVFGLIFGVLFTLEIVLRMAALRLRFVFDGWNWLDTTIVVLWIIETLEDNIPIDPLLIRLTRLAKLARLTRIVRKIQVFDSLFLMTTALRSSFSILCWSCCLLLVILMLNALLLNQILVEFYFKNDKFPLDERKELYRFFGTFTASLFSMFELTLANWPPISRMLYEYVNQWFLFVCILHKVTIGFAVVGVINGVFVQETFKVAQMNDELMLRRGRVARRVHAEKMKRLMRAADKSGDGELDIQEFRAIFEHSAVRELLACMDFVAPDVDTLFEMMDRGHGAISVEDVIKGVAKYKGAARNIDLHHLLHQQRRLERLIERHVLQEHAGVPSDRTPIPSDRTSIPSEAHGVPAP